MQTPHSDRMTGLRMHSPARAPDPRLVQAMRTASLFLAWQDGHPHHWRNFHAVNPSTARFLFGAGRDDLKVVAIEDATVPLEVGGRVELASISGSWRGEQPKMGAIC